MFQISVQNKKLTPLKKTIHGLGGVVTAVVQSEEGSDCFFIGDEQFLDALQAQLQAQLPHLKIIRADSIDWNEQSALHSPFYANGRIEIPLPNAKVLTLLPGAAFGDASHPSTRLSLELLSGKVFGKSFLDIGTGNGVLALASALMGSTYAVGVEIDPDALLVAHQNCALNNLEQVVTIITPDQFVDSSYDIVVANMTLGDQQNAFTHYQNSLKSAHCIILSGLLQGQEEEAIKLLPSGWQIEERICEGEWVALFLNR